MTRKIWTLLEECTDDDLNAIVDDIVLTQMLAVYPYSMRNTARVSRVVGDADARDSVGGDALILSIPILPVRGDHLWIRYEYHNEVSSGSWVALYRIYDRSENELLASFTKVHTASLTPTKSDALDVIDLGSVPTFGDLSALEVQLEMRAYWQDAASWWDAQEETEINDSVGVTHCLWRPYDNAIFFMGDGHYYFWDQDHVGTDFSARRDENPPTYGRSASGIAYHPTYGVIIIGSGGPTPGVRSRGWANGLDHYSTGSQNDATDYHEPTGFENHSDTVYDYDICRESDIFVAISSATPGGTPGYTTRGAILQNTFGPLADPDPAWEGSSTEILNDGSSNTYLPQSGASHPADPTVLDPEIWDVYIKNDDPEGGGGRHYFARYSWQGDGNTSSSVVYQYNNNVFELLDELDNFYDYGNTTYGDPGFIAPAVAKHNPSKIGIAYWEHIKNAADDHDMHVRVLYRSGAPGAAGTWTKTTVHSVTGLTDTQFNAWNWHNQNDANHKGQSPTNLVQIDYAFDWSGAEHIVYSYYIAADTNRQVYYRKKELGGAWGSEVKLSVGTAWDAHKTSGQPVSIYSLALLKDNGYVPQPGTDLRVAWGSRNFSLVYKHWIAGIQLSSGEGDISIFAPEVFMNDRDDTAGPEDMLWS